MLRVFLSALPDDDRADPWLRTDASGRVTERGSAVRARWPDDAHVDIVLAAAHVRLAALDLPPMPPGRLHQAARYALEDRMAASPEDAAIAITARHRPVIAAIAARSTIDGLRDAVRKPTRIVPESALAPRAPGWTWCASAAGNGFIRREDGSAFAVDEPQPGVLPTELQAALTQARRASDVPATVNVAFAADAARLDAWTTATGVRFVAAPAWHWEDAGDDAYAAAPDFLAGDDAATGAATPRAARSGRFRPALVLAALAIALHVGALLAQWAWLDVTEWRLSRQLVEDASAAGLPASSPASAAAALARRNADARHAASKSAARDALPLLARAAAALGELPRGLLKSATYADDAWTFETGKLDGAAASRLTRALGHAGLDAIAAPTAAGLRVRVTLSPTAR